MKYFNIMPLDKQAWAIPRSLMCTGIWSGFILIFIGMIMVVAGQHNEIQPEMYVGWGGVIMGVGFLLLAVCAVLCVHALCIMRKNRPTVKNISHHYGTNEGYDMGYADACSKECLMKYEVKTMVVAEQDKKNPNKVNTVKIANHPRIVPEQEKSIAGMPGNSILKKNNTNSKIVGGGNGHNLGKLTGYNRQESQPGYNNPSYVEPKSGSPRPYDRQNSNQPKRGNPAIFNNPTNPQSIQHDSDNGEAIYAEPMSIYVTQPSQNDAERITSKPPFKTRQKGTIYGNGEAYPTRTQSVKTPTPQRRDNERRRSGGDYANLPLTPSPDDLLTPPSYEDVTGSNVSVYDNVPTTPKGNGEPPR
ncbi:uncharacterized protein LOC106154158 [Lingula anatina]|uniref:Uncharacterized protein LOC106154158 n=1 Tax=Lingula anatina TaxID=7574 RepID=A0A1S3HD14_LINAN|nr:uncharacterized protein LOC106154158 [Lingula anatina]XP_013383889.1 uncharacterized protein LOC106154158 [Lingula anatina]|eukprot:XP_013383880.1 uncharacterized protein LOC106154158 [Lingula anatina]